MGYSVWANAALGFDLSDWVSDGEIFSDEDWDAGDIPDIDVQDVSLEREWAEYLGYRYYLRVGYAFAGTDDINAREFGSTVGSGPLPSPEEVEEGQKKISEAIAKIAAHYDVDDGNIPHDRIEVLVIARYG